MSRNNPRQRAEKGAFAKLDELLDESIKAIDRTLADLSGHEASLSASAKLPARKHGDSVGAQSTVEEDRHWR